MNPKDDPMRPFIQLPTWDGKIVLAALLIIGYYALVLMIAGATPAGELTATRASVVHDALLTLGPPIGLVFGALFRNTAADERSAVLRSGDLRAALETPTVPTDTPTPTPTAPEIKEAVKTGAAEGTEAGVSAGLNGDRVDTGRFPEVDAMLRADRPEFPPQKG